MKKLINFLFIITLAGISIFLLITCRSNSVHSEMPEVNYGQIKRNIQSLIDSQSTYYIHKGKFTFANNIEQLGDAKTGGEIRLKQILDADYNSQSKKASNGYFYTTFPIKNNAGAEKKYAVIIAIPEHKNNPFFVALYGQKGVSIQQSRLTQIYQCNYTKDFTDEIIFGENISVEIIQTIINKSQPIK